MRNWTPNKGSCPVPEGTLIDVIHRDGEVFKKEIVGAGNAATYTYSNNWELDGYEGDIIFWRLSKSKKEKAA